MKNFIRLPSFTLGGFMIFRSFFLLNSFSAELMFSVGLMIIIWALYL
jgi:hypothetical protein